MKWGNDLLDLAEQLQDAHGIAAGWPLFRSALGRFGVTDVGYAFSWRQAGGADDIVMHYDYPQAFLDRYDEAGHVNNDWALKHCLSEPERVALTTERATANLSSAEMQLEHECLDFGLEHFAMIPLRDGRMGKGGISAAFRGISEAEFRRLAAAHVDDLRGIGLIFHSAMRSQPGLGGLVELSPREREVLTWTAAGRSSKVIAHRLNLSTRTVEHHIASAAKRLGAHNRTHAVAKALVLNLIRP